LRVWGEEKSVRALREMTGSTSRGSEGGVMSGVLADSDIRGVSISSSEISSEMAIKKFCILTLVAQEIFVITIITKAFELAFNHFRPSQFLDL
jgi:hypothetical protein